MIKEKILAAQSALSYVEDSMLMFRATAIDAIKNAVSILGETDLDLYLSAPHDSTSIEDIAVNHHIIKIFTADDHDGETYLIEEILDNIGGQVTEVIEDLSANELYELAKEMERKIQNKFGC